MNRHGNKLFVGGTLEISHNLQSYADHIAFLDPDTLICFPPIIEVNNDTLNVNDTGIIQWINCDDGSIISGATSNTFIPTSFGNYAAIVNDGSCNDTSACVSYTGVNDKFSVVNRVTVYPNPVTSIATIQYQTTNSSKSTVTVENCLGQVMLTQNLKPETRNTVIDMSNYASGMYFIKCFDGKQQTVVKVVKE